MSIVVFVLEFAVKVPAETLFWVMVKVASFTVGISALVAIVEVSTENVVPDRFSPFPAE